MNPLSEKHMEVIKKAYVQALHTGFRTKEQIPKDLREEVYQRYLDELEAKKK